MSRKITVTHLLAFFLALTLPAAGVAAQEPSEEARDELHQNLRDAEVALDEIQERASELKIYTMQSASMMFWKSHTYEVNRIEERVEQLGELVPKLQESSAVKPWQKEIVDEIAALVKAMAGQTEKAIQFLEENHSRPEFAESSYQARVASIYRFAEHVDELVDHVQGDWDASARTATE